MCTPRSQGGLGFRSMKAFNLTLIAKLGWKVLSNFDNVGVKQLWGKYISYGNFLSSPSSPNASLLGKGIQKSNLFCHLAQVSKFLRPQIYQSGPHLGFPRPTLLSLFQSTQTTRTYLLSLLPTL